MAKPNPLWSQFGAASSMCKAGSMCNNHYPSQSSQVQQSNNLTSVYGMFYDQNLRQEPSRSSGSHIGNGSHYLPSQQVALPPTMPLSQQGYVGLPFSAYSLPLTHNFIHRPVAHVDPQNYQYFTGSHNYGSSTTRRVTPYQRSVRPERRRTQESVRRGFEIIRPDMETSRRNVPLRNMLDPVASISTTGMPQSPVVSVGAANESMTVRQFLSSWRDRDEELPERTGVVGHNDNYGLGSLTIPTQASPSLNAPPTQAETSSFMGTSNQESGWAGEERRIERISNPDMIPLMYPIPQMQPSHLTQAESVQQISQAHLGPSAGLPPPPWQCLDLQGQQCYGGPPSSTDYRTDETRPSIQPQRHYNINSSIETGEIFDDINGTRESRHRSSSNSLQTHTLSSNRSNNVFPNEERLWESALHPSQNLNYPTMSGENVGSHSVGSLVNVGYYDSYVGDTGNMVANTLRDEITPPPAHPDTTTRDPQETVEQVTTEPPLSSEEINLSLAQAAENVTTQQLCFPESNNDCQNEANNRLNVSHSNEDAINKIDDEFENDIIESTLHDTIIKEDLQLDTNENSKIKNNNIINENNNRVGKVGSLSSPADTQTDDNVSDSTNDRSESPTKHAVNHTNQLQSLSYGNHAEPYDNIAAEQMILPNGCNQEEEIDAAVYDVCSEYQSPSETAPLELPNLLQTLKSPPSVTEQDTPSDVCDNRSFDEKLQEKVNLETVEYPIKDDVSDDFTLIEHSESEVDVKEESDEPVYDELEQLGARLWSLTQATQLHPLALPSKVDQRTCPAGSSRAASLSVSKTLLTVSHLIVKNDVTPIPNLVIKKTNTAYMSYLKSTTAKQGNLLAYLRKTEKYKLNNNGFTSKTRGIDGISVKGSHQKTRTQECEDFKEGKLDVEIHHCLLCGQSYLSKDEMFKHEQSSGHRRLELVQRRAHHWAYQRATGSSDPNVPILTPKDHEFLVHLPHIPGFRNYYHHSSHFTDLD